jgi:hypothetical protein
MKSWTEEVHSLTAGRTPRSVLLRWGFARTEEVPDLYGRVSSFFLEQFALETAVTGAPHSVGFIVPSGGKELAKHLSLALLVADFAHRKGNSDDGLNHGLVEGDVLLVSQKTYQAERLISNYQVGDVSLSDYWNVTRGEPEQGDDERPRLSVVNPGWIQSHDEIPDSFYAVIFDGANPRALPHLERTIEKANAPLRALVSPALGKYRLDRLKDLGIDLWLWDEESKHTAAEALDQSEWSFPSPSPQVKISPVGNENVDFYLEYAHRHLMNMIGEEHSSLSHLWILYNYLRRLTVPILELDKKRRNLFRTRPLSQQLEDLPSAVSGSAILETNWPEVTGALQSAYEELKQYTRPPKQEALVERVQAYLEEDATPVRIVLPTKHESELLVAQIEEQIEGLAPAIQSGEVQFVTESRRENLPNDGVDVVPGYRTGRFRHLSAIPGSTINVLAYPHEVEITRRVLDSLEKGLETVSKNESRSSFLKSIGLAPGGSTRVDPAISIRIEVSGEVQGEGQQARIDDHEQEYALDDIIPDLSISHSDTTDAAPGSGDETRTETAEVTVYFEDGSLRNYSQGRMVSVWYEEDIQRVRTENLMVGQRVIVFVDEAYSDLYERFLETISQRRSTDHETALQTWRYLKQEALSGHASVQELYRVLDRKGLSVGDNAVRSWYDTGPNRTIAPIDREDFALLARHAKPDLSNEAIDTLYGFIKSERQTRRNAGRWLKKLLRNAASAQSVPSIDGIEADMTELYDAIDLRTIVEMEKPE